MLRTYRIEYKLRDHHSLWETDPVHIAALYERAHYATRSSRAMEHEFPSDRGPTPLGAEWAESYGYPFRMTQRFFPSQAAVDAANALAASLAVRGRSAAVSVAVYEA